MTVDEKLKEVEEYFDKEIDHLHEVIAEMRMEIAILKAKWMEATHE
jgi:hypothetical protein